ncbi:hypothetical protein L596_028670 [Steinernema carpocapsae]|uniref:Uncharacterized protein n=1 Tax=Steinernema carpocapsae TaxID=34508 RepID=A0A4U5LZ51_STECR|nr:hypothetical protein L596_028670 [Steinernema carpocapsae]
MSSELATVFEAKYSLRKLHPIPEEDAVSFDSSVFSVKSPFIGSQESLDRTPESSFLDLEKLGFEVVLPVEPKASPIVNPEALQKTIKFNVEDEGARRRRPGSQADSRPILQLRFVPYRRSHLR